MPPALVLHHYELSPFAEKIRRILAFKQVPWTQVRAPAVMPKPDLVALTGGYRRIPVLQIGNHVYCDTALIAREIERRHPTPTLYPTPIAESLAEWGDQHFQECVNPIVLRPTRFDDVLRWLTKDEAARIGEDRKALAKDSATPRSSFEALRARFDIYVTRIEGSLERTPYLLGQAPSIADFSVYHGLWLISRVAPEVLATRPNVLTFVGRLSAFRDPPIATLTGSEALELCKRSDNTWRPPAWSDPEGFTPGQRLTVRANDYGRDPVSGELVFSAANEIVLHRDDPHAGEVYVHFPRVGYEITAS